MFTRKIRATLGAFGLVAVSFLATACGDPCKKTTNCTADGRCTSKEDKTCHAAKDADCVPSQACTQFGKCSAQKGACVALKDATCQASDGCKSGGDCSAYQGACVSQTKALHGICMGSCGAEGRCVLQEGECTATDRFYCTGAHDGPPLDSSPCARFGFCQIDKGRCVAGSDADCQGSQLCKNAAQCRARDGACFAAEGDCKKSEACTTHGRCSAIAGRCAALTEADCKPASACKAEGACSAIHGVCMAATEADCAQSAACKESGRCKVVDGMCISDAPPPQLPPPPGVAGAPSKATLGRGGAGSKR